MRQSDGQSRQQSQHHFFWDKKNAKKSSKTRFNLLLLEFGEYFLEDFSAYHFPCPSLDLTKSFEINEGLKVQGRLKLCSRSLIFEPSDIRKPLLKFPFKTISNNIEVFNLKASELASLSIQVSGAFTFVSTGYFEMKSNDKIGPYKLVDSTNRIVFALVHSDLNHILIKIEQFRHIFKVSEKQGSGMGIQLMKPFIETALITSFDTSHLVDFHEKLLLQTPMSVKKVKPLIINPGSLMITDVRVYFQPSVLNNIGDSIQHFELRKIHRVFKRRYLLRQTGLELVLIDGSSALFAFDSKVNRDSLFELILSQQNTKTSQLSLEQVTRKWQRREMTNFEYLMYLNNEADRSFNDLTQYPVFPHLITDFQSKKINFESPQIYRDLSKPIGALNPERLKYFKERFNSMPPRDDSLGLPPPFLYGTHYTTPGYVLYYLVRVAPEYMLCLQNGKFDAPDRMFHSVASNWDSCLNNPADLKELIPEFYCGNGEFLLNLDELELGYRHTGGRLNDVVLPPWADSPRDFIRKNSKALESEYVSENIHFWIDLIFGFKQQGQAAIEADNLFYYLTYEGSVDLEQITDETERAALEIQIQEFGQSPKQLFSSPHPRRSDLSAPIVLCDNNLSSHMKSGLMEGSSNVQNKSLTRNGSKMNNSLQQSIPQTTIISSDTTTTTNNNNNRNGIKDMKLNNKNNSFFDDDEFGVKSMAMLDIDEDLKIELDRELKAIALPNISTQKSGFDTNNNNVKQSQTVPQNNTTNQSNKPITKPMSGFMSNLGFWTEKTATFIDKTFGITPVTPNNNVEIINNYDNRNNINNENRSQRNSKESKTNNATFISSKTDPSFVKVTQKPDSPNKEVGLNSNSSSPKNNLTDKNALISIDPFKITLIPSPHFQWHNQPITGLAIVMLDHLEEQIHPYLNSEYQYGDSNDSFDSGHNGETILTKSLTILVSSSSKDSYLKVTQVDFKATADGGTFLSTQKRSYSASNAPLTACCMAQDHNRVLLASLDNHLYGYSISNHEDDQKNAHEDGVSLKLWSIKSATNSNKKGSTRIIGTAAIASFYDHDNSVSSVSLDDTGTFAAAGSENGALIVWHIHTQSLLFNYVASRKRKAITCLKWIPVVATKQYYSINHPPANLNFTLTSSDLKPPAAGVGYLSSGITHSEDILICGTFDGRILCIDSAARLLADCQLEVGIECLTVDDRGIIYVGFSDG
eukprot:gene15463-20862_t